MHDIIAHNIAVMIALADGAAYTAPADPAQAAEVMTQVSETGRSALTEMRRLLGIMRQPVPGGDAARAPQPTLADLDTLLERVRRAGLTAVLTESGTRPALPPGAQLAIYRIVQESLTNTLKHASAASARVFLRYDPGVTEIEITDDGRAGSAVAGAAPGTPRPGYGTGSPVPGPGGASGGHGIAGMTERAAVFGGTLTAAPRPGGGWRVHARLRPGPARHQPTPVTSMQAAPAPVTPVPAAPAPAGPGAGR
jgi:signal transduction histidine kinase